MEALIHIQTRWLHFLWNHLWSEPLDASDTSTKLLSEGRHCDSDLRNLNVSILALLFMQTYRDQSGWGRDFLHHPPINYTAFINTGLMNGPCKKGELRGGVNTAPACTHVATY